MEGRRVSSRRTGKYNPLFILFVCLIAAVLILLVISIVLGARLRSANKKLDAAEAQVTELTESVSRLQEQVLTAESRIPASPSSGGSETAPSGGGSTPGGSSSSGGSSGSWLDLTGHSEVSVVPSKLLDAYQTYYTTAGVNLRSGPATSYNRITTVELGTKVDVAAREGNWSFVRAEGKFGWISSDYLSTTQPSGPASSSSSSSSSSSRSSSSGSRSEATSGNLR